AVISFSRPPRPKSRALGTVLPIPARLGLPADAMRRTKARLSLPSLSFVHNWERRRLTNGSSNRLDSFRKYSPLRVGAKQEVLAVGDPVSGSGAAEPLSNHRRGHRRADGEAHRGPS